MAGWHVAKNGAAKGPLSDAEMLAAIDAKEILPGSLVWKKGMNTWQPIELHFAQGFSAPAQMPPPAPKTLSDFRLLRIYAALVVITLPLFFFIAWHSESLEGQWLFAVVWGGTLLASIISGGLLLRTTWRIAAQKSAASNGTQGGGYKLAAVGWGIVLFMYSLFFLSQSTLIYRINAARKHYENYTMQVNASAHEVVVNGTIGPTFAMRFAEALEQDATLDTLVITSGGGLVDQALDAAHLIAKKRMTVIAHRDCHSACLIVLMAGDKRFADWNMNLGFHATAHITEMGDGVDGLSGLSKEADSYLAKRGVPQDVIDHAFSKGSRKLELVPSIRLAESGSLTGLLEGNRPVTLVEAKWRIVENATHAMDDSSVSAFSGVMLAVRETSPQLVLKHADRLYDAFVKADSKAVGDEVRAFIGKLVPEAMRSAGDEELLAYMENNQRQMEYLAQKKAWPTCMHYIGGDISSDFDVLSKPSMKAEFDALASLIRSAGMRDWKKQDVPAWAARRGDELLKQAVKEIMNQGVDLSHIKQDAKAKCLVTNTIMKKMIAEGPQVAAPLMRWITQNFKPE